MTSALWGSWSGQALFASWGSSQLVTVSHVLCLCLVSCTWKALRSWIRNLNHGSSDWLWMECRMSNMAKGMQTLNGFMNELWHTAHAAWAARGDMLTYAATQYSINRATCVQLSVANPAVCLCVWQPCASSGALVHTVGICSLPSPHQPTHLGEQSTHRGPSWIQPTSV